MQAWPPARKLKKLLLALRYDGRPPRSLAEVEAVLDGHVCREQEARGDDEAGGAEYALGDLAECIKLLMREARQQLKQRRREGGGSSMGAENDDGEEEKDGEEGLRLLNEQVDANFGSTRDAYVLPSQRRQVIELSTVHKAKGLGWPIVYLLEPQELPMQFILEQGGWQARQEYNVQYVAYTRSERTLVFLKNVIPHGPKAEHFSLHDAIVRVLFNGEEGPGVGGGPRAHPRDDPAWSANSAFEDWGEFFGYGSQGSSQGSSSSQDGGDECMSVCRAREALGLPPVPAPLKQKDVTAAYRRLALQLHPDRCKDADATQLFQEVSAAKEALERELNGEPDE